MKLYPYQKEALKLLTSSEYGRLHDGGVILANPKFSFCEDVLFGQRRGKTFLNRLYGSWPNPQPRTGDMRQMIDDLERVNEKLLDARGLSIVYIDIIDVDVDLAAARQRAYREIMESLALPKELLGRD